MKSASARPGGPSPRRNARRDAAARFLRRGEIRALAGILAQSEERGWLVGGAPRDLILGRPTTDADVAVTGDLDAIGREMESRGFGRAVRLSNSPPRVLRIAGPRELDLVELAGGDVRSDLARRDFTANAIALDLSTGDWQDPFGGIADLQARRLRLISRSNLVEDPLRILRAARFQATHGLRPDAETTRACLGLGGRLSTVAPERVRAELVKLLEAPVVAPALRWALRVGALGPALGLSARRTRTLSAILSRLDRASLRARAPGRRARARLALIAAQVGFSAEEILEWLRTRRFSREESGEIGALVLLVAEARRARGGRDFWCWIRDAGRIAPDAIALLAAGGPGDRLRARQLTARRARVRRGPRIRGEDVLSWLSLAPGPAVGQVLREIEVEILRGAVKTRRKARLWVSKHGPRLVIQARDGPDAPFPASGGRRGL